MALSNQVRGILICTTGVIAISPDTLLVRMLDIDKWALLFYRGLIIGIGLTLLSWLVSKESLVKQFKQIGTPGIGVAIMFSCSTICFVTSLYYTSVANTLIILSTSSMFAAFYSKLFLKERIRPETVLTMLVVTGATGYIVSDSIGGGGLTGDLIAIGAAMAMAASFTITRYNRSSNMVPATAISGFLVAAISFIPASFPMLDFRIIVLLMSLGLLLTVAFGLLTIGPRYISSPEVSLLLQIEVVLGPFFIWLVLHESPSVAALIGGAIIIAALSAHALVSIRKSGRSMS